MRQLGLSPLSKMKLKKHQGFTLVEILMVLTILVILSAILTTGIQNFVVRQNFKNTVVDVRDGVIETRLKTLASLNDTLYGVHVSSTAVVFFDGIDFVEGYVGNKTINLPANILATTTFSNDMSTATFTRLTGWPSATGTIVLSDATSNNSATITLSATGVVD
jgi:prepilin-type N-terminal cleavage/methylation domain-containing protein